MLYQARTIRADHGKKKEIGEVSPVVHAVAAAWSQEIDRKSATCSATVHIRSRGGVGLTPTHRASGSDAATVGNTAGRDDRHADRVDDLRNQRKRAGLVLDLVG